MNLKVEDKAIKWIIVRIHLTFVSMRKPIWLLQLMTNQSIKKKVKNNQLKYVFWIIVKK